jgi:hypothetical protein
MPRYTRLLPIGALAAALAAGACSESTSPGGTDPAAVAADVGGLGAVFTAGVGFQSLNAMVGSFALTAPPARPAAAPARGFSRAAVIDLMRWMGARAPAATQNLFPPSVLGRTFVWDTSSGGRYRIDTTVTGAPAAGVRFTLYYVPSGNSKPSAPLLPVGYVDLTDQSTPQANTLGVKIQKTYSGSQTLANYAINGVRDTGSFTLSAAGYLTDTTNRQVTFSLSNVLKSDSTLRVNDTLTAASGARVWMQLAESGTAQARLLTLGDHYLRAGHTVDVTGTAAQTAVDTSFNVAFAFNGVAYATVSGTGSNPVFTGAGGQVLTGFQELALITILAGFFDIFEHANVVFAPSALVFK